MPETIIADTTQQTQQTQETTQQTQQTTTQAQPVDVRTLLDASGKITNPEAFWTAMKQPHLAKRFSTLEAPFGSYASLEKQFSTGQKVILPTENSTPEEWDAFFAKTRGVEKEDDYKVEAPEALKTVLDAEAVKSFKGLAFKHGVPAKAVQALSEWYMQHTGKAIEGMQQQTAQTVETGMVELEQDLGPRTGQKFKEAIAGVASFVKDLGGEELLNDHAFASNPKFIKMALKMKAMTKEAPAAGARAGAGEGMGQGDPMAKVQAIRADKNHPYNIKGHPQHKAAVDEVNALFQQKYGNEPVYANVRAP